MTWGEILLENNVVHLFQCCYVSMKIYSSLHEFITQSVENLCSLFQVGTLRKDLINRHKLTDSNLKPKDYLQNQGDKVNPIILKDSNDDVEGTTIQNLSFTNGNLKDDDESKTVTIDNGVKIEKENDISKIIEIDDDDTTKSLSSQDGDVTGDIETEIPKNDSDMQN